MSPRLRILAFGTTAVLVIAGGVCAALISGVVGEVLTIVLISGGLAGALLLVFLEVGLSEERELAREEQRRRQTKLRALRLRRGSRPRQLPRRPR